MMDLNLIAKEGFKSIPILICIYNYKHFVVSMLLLINIYCFMVFDNPQFFIDLQPIVANLFLSQMVVIGLEKLFIHI
jgi:hypothetical protein